MARPQFKNYFRMIELAGERFPNFPQRWLVTSIDHHTTSFRSRNSGKFKNKTHHRDSMAVDISPLWQRDGKTGIWLPVPLNRNLLMMGMLYEVYQLVDGPKPFIGIEADHLHADVFRPADLIMYHEVRPALDQRGAQFLKRGGRALNTRKIVSLNRVFR